MNPENVTNSVTPQEQTPSVAPIKPIGKKHSLRTTLSIVTVMVLVVGVFGAVGLSLQSQDNRSHASGYTSYGNYYSVTNSTGSINNILCLIFGGCSSSGGTATPIPCGFTTTASYNTYRDTYNRYYSKSSSYTPPCPTPTQVPYYQPTAAPTQPPYVNPPTVAPYSGNAVANLKVYLHGIGNGGDNVNPTSQGNMTPVHPQRNASVQVFNAANQLVSDNPTTISYDTALGAFKGQATLGGIESGAYTVKIKTDQYLRGLVPGIQNITKGQTVTLGDIRLVDGDVNGDNQVNILDYNILIGCYSDLSPAVSCTPENNLKSDINDDGHVNQYDYNLFLRELSNVNGQ